MLPDLTVNFTYNTIKEVWQVRDIILLIVVLATALYGYYVTRKLDNGMADNRRRRAAEKGISGGTVRIAAEDHHVLAAVTPALEYCSELHPDIRISIRRNGTRRLLRRLSDGDIDIALLSEETVKGLGRGFAYIPIPAEEETDARAEAAPPVYAAYRKNIPSPLRDRVIFYLETEHCRLKTGYCDYMD